LSKSSVGKRVSDVQFQSPRIALWHIPSFRLERPGCWAREDIGAAVAGVFWGVLGTVLVIFAVQRRWGKRVVERLTEQSCRASYF
jgi:hypothetical protein